MHDRMILGKNNQPAAADAQGQFFREKILYEWGHRAAEFLHRAFNIRVADDGANQDLETEQQQSDDGEKTPVAPKQTAQQVARDHHYSSAQRYPPIPAQERRDARHDNEQVVSTEH